MHCKITRDSSTNLTFLEDLSSNGTWLNEVKIGKNNKVEIKNGDIIYLLHKTKVAEQDIMGYVFSFLNLPKIDNKKLAEETINETLKQEQEKKTKLDDELGEEMQCPICIDYIYQCVSMIPCLHIFCAACYSGWMEKSKECPQCREPVLEARKNANVNNIIDKFLVRFPDKKRPKEEYEKMDKVNKFTIDRNQITITEKKEEKKEEEKKTDNIVNNNRVLNDGNRNNKNRIQLNNGFPNYNNMTRQNNNLRREFGNRAHYRREMNDNDDDEYINTEDDDDDDDDDDEDEDEDGDEDDSDYENEYYY